ncbi:divalent-cation tolerance protein CutA [Fodinicurvata sediminis]|uniref:divalent-cation tolerance protein CutA n=1 Tax=Fodinicurvata sediminis TaxID=1121832 RepID=UPI0003B68C2A|nr:divalent-cation tolerance protein CutA [Fodinicurvata sediminis]
MQCALLYITFSDEAAARALGRKLVEARLAACANIFASMIPIFRWEDQIQEDSESVMIAKTRKELVEEATDFIKRNHDYDCPCVVALPLEGGNKDFLEWIVEETKDPET